ncbi:MAG: sulfotransferase [Deltaproteobacteria bacterium]|nr:sulfotransferase [Deltaproteobacteria bacterium]
MHIVGCERSGTTLLLEMMTAGFAIGGRCEREQSLFLDPPPGEGPWVSKKPLDILRLETVFRRDPSLFALYLVRDPRSVVASRHAARPERYHSDFSTWSACERAARRLDGHPRFLRIRYERLVEAPDAVQDEIAKRLEFLHAKGLFSRFQETAAPSRGGLLALGGLREPDRSRIEAWRGDLPRVKAEWLRHPELPRALIEAGYETDESWLALLEGVAPAPWSGSSRLRSGLRDLDRWIRYRVKSWQYLARRSRRSR